MEGRWSSEALQAMETHLGLLRKANGPCETTGRPLETSYEADTGPILDLNSNVPLPYGWEQFLDLQTGQVYYVDWKNCRRSYIDPRNFPPNRPHDDCDNSEMSECMSDAEDGCVSSIHNIKSVHTNKFLTIPMLQEDWDLMETRGWMVLDCDNHSELTSEMKPTSPLNIISSPNGMKRTLSYSLYECESSSSAKIDSGTGER
ncbi:hypothetical protein GOP47_0023940 [Adiantum capillus-veneris]|uniref:WW domain-containing protein n=1 Tax=Adiantum capillus-veneris TaxID=13818 RepID=A0A9D4Z527_ADICA|nr:hypothetical protein GOP47_0023940 [Adiantum capillus-veneris]